MKKDNEVQNHGEVYLFEIANKTLEENKSAKAYNFNCYAKINQYYSVEGDDSVMLRINDEISNLWVTCNLSKMKTNIGEVTNSTSFIKKIKKLKNQDLLFSIAYAYTREQDPIYIVLELDQKTIKENTLGGK